MSEGITQEEKDKLWTELKAQWKLQKEGKEQDSQKAEKRINEIQRILGLDVTDFESRNGKEEKSPEYTEEQAKSIFDEDELEIIDKAQNKAIAFRELVAKSTPKKYPAVKGNHAGIGQIVNLTWDLAKEKLRLG